MLLFVTKVAYPNGYPNMQEDIQEDFGWKLVHGDVFRPPSNIMLLSVFIGNGVQIVLMTFIALGKKFWALCLFSFIDNVET